MLRKLNRVYRQLRAFFPKQLPKGMTEFESWVKNIIDLSEAPDNETTRFMIANSILHAPSGDAYKPARWFVNYTRKVMANEVAAGKMHQLKEEQKARLELQAAQAKAAEEQSQNLSVAPDAQVANAETKQTASS